MQKKMVVSGPILGRIWSYLDVSGYIWAGFKPYLDVSDLGRFLVVSGRIWTYLGVSGPFLGSIWTYLGVSGTVLGRISGRI